MSPIEFIVPGVPVGKGRPRITTRGGKFPRAFTPEKTANYENLVKLAAAQAMTGRDLIEGPVEMVLHLFVAPAESWSMKKKAQALDGKIRPTSKPDADNVLKAIADACNGVVWKDDSQITDCVIRKRYAAAPSARVVIRGAVL